MATIKSYTDLSQSKALSKILPLKRSDMTWINVYDENHMMSDHRIDPIPFRFYQGTGIPAWSLSALLEVLPNENMLVKTTDGEYYCLAKDVMTKHYDNPVDACYEMIILLHKLNLL